MPIRPDDPRLRTATKDHPLASDGIIARANGRWAKDKLSFLDDFVPPALTATSKKQQRHFIDLFAGPGSNIDKRAEDEFPGSTIRVLPKTSSRDDGVAFTNAVAVNMSELDDAALRIRIDRLFAEGKCHMPRDHVQQIRGDANRELPGILRGVHPDAYALVFADITKPNHWPWSTVEALRAQNHRSVDLYMLFPLAMGINRLVPWESPASADALTRFFGNEHWRPIVERRLTKALAPTMRQELLELYIAQLKGLGWIHSYPARDICRVGSQGLYRMIYASANKAGDRIGKWAARRRGRPDRDGQLGFGFIDRAI
jgi:three-Cys-motif partner protein